MNRIKTTDILDPSIQQPFTGRSLDFLQDSNKAIFLAIAQTLIGETYSILTPYVLKGVNAYGTNQYNAGYILWNEEIYYTPGKSTTTAFVDVPVMTITVANDPTADPLEFTDGVPRNVHNIRTIVLSDASSGSGTFDLTDSVYVQSSLRLQTKVIEIGDWDMDSTDYVDVAHGITFENIRGMSAIIKHDNGLNYWNFIHDDPSSSALTTTITIDSLNIRLQRATGCLFDGVNFNSTSYNRGWITIQYIA